MTIEIHELIIQARIGDGSTQGNPSSAKSVQSSYQYSQQQALIEQITQRVLEHLRDEQGGWL